MNETNETHIIIFSGPAASGGRVRRIEGDSLVIGRGASASVDLSGDALVNPEHVRLSIIGGTYFIEDMGSTHGTLVSGSEIKGGGPIEVQPGVEIAVGATRWTFLSREWVVLDANEVVVYGRCARVINYAVFRCGMPVVDSLTAVNTSGAVSDAFQVTFSLPGYADPWAVNVPALEADQSVSLPSPAMALNVTALKTVLEPQRALLKMSAGASVEREISVLGPSDWSYAPEARVTIGAFVSPRDPEVERIVLNSQTEAVGIEGLLKRGQPDVELAVMRIIYDYLATRSIRYEMPVAADGYQTVRSQSRIFTSEEGDGAGLGTCLDLTLLFAACLEHVGLCPMILFVCDNSSRPVHSFVACKRGTTPTFRPIVRDVARLKSEMERDAIYVLECTGFAEGARNDGKLTFEEAVESAREQLTAASRAFAVDIASIRPPYGPMTSISYPPLDGIVAQAYALALEFAESKRSKTLESVHLLYGLLAAKGDVTTGILGKMNQDASVLRSRISAVVSFGQSPMSAVPTRNYRKCARMAEQFAEILPGSTVREEHVWWALLESRSRNLIALLDHLGIDADELARNLRSYLPQQLINLEQSSVLMEWMG